MDRHDPAARPSASENEPVSRRELLRYGVSLARGIGVRRGGGVEFMRVFAEDVYGVPPENGIGSTAIARC